jgi:hypothetical protein
MKKKQNKIGHRIAQRRELKAAKRTKLYNLYMLEFYQNKHKLRFEDWRNEKKISN